MEEKPRNPKHSLFAGGSGVSLILNGILIGALTLAAFVIGARVYTGTTSLFPIFPENISEDALTHAQTMAFVVLSVSQLIHSLNMRHPHKSIFQIGLFTNKWLIASVLFGIFLQDVVITVPFLRDVFKVFDLNAKDWLFVGLLSVVPLVVNEIVKIFIRMKKSK
jgi:Ca2+-transporting ATPase